MLLNNSYPQTDCRRVKSTQLKGSLELADRTQPGLITASSAQCTPHLFYLLPVWPADKNSTNYSTIQRNSQSSQRYDNYRAGKGNGSITKSHDSPKPQSLEGEHLKRAVNLLESGQNFSASAVLKTSFASVKVSAQPGQNWAMCCLTEKYIDAQSEFSGSLAFREILFCRLHLDSMSNLKQT